MKTTIVFNVSEVPGGINFNKIYGNYTGILKFNIKGIIDLDFTYYLLNGKLHRLDGPAYIQHKVINNKKFIETKQYFTEGKRLKNLREYKIAKQQHILLENMKRIRNIT